MEPQSMQHDFLQALFGENPGKDLYFQLWTKADKKTHYFPTANQAAKFAASKPDDLYVAVSLAPKKYGPARRAPAVESAGIPGVWADIDVNGGPEGKTGAADSKEIAEKLAFCDLEPTIIVDSGYGLQAWWLFEDGPWLFNNDDEERAKAARMATGWIALVRSRAREMGFGIDATQDLARLLRVPGTFNCKGGTKAPCTFFYGPDDWLGPRHPREHILELALSAAPEATAVRETLEGLVGEFEIKPDAEVPFGKMNAALKNYPMFDKTWNHTRKDRVVENWSMSEWDLSLASLAAHLGWTDQEIADLIVAHRREHGDVEKALRPDYIRGTLAKARRERVATARENKVEQHLDNLEAHGQQGTNDPDAVMADFNGVVDAPNFTVKELIQDGEDPKQTRYRLIIEPGGREISIGPIDVLFDPDQFAKAIATQTRHVMPTVKRDRWRNALQGLMNVCRVTVSDDDTPQGIVIEWLGRYVGERLLKDQTEAARRREPFEKDEQVYVFAASFHTFVTRSIGNQVNPPDLKQMLKSAGFEQHTVSFHAESGRPTSRSYYRAPKDVIE